MSRYSKSIVSNLSLLYVKLLSSLDRVIVLMTDSCYQGKAGVEGGATPDGDETATGQIFRRAQVHH